MTFVDYLTELFYLIDTELEALNLRLRKGGLRKGGHKGSVENPR